MKRNNLGFKALLICISLPVLVSIPALANQDVAKKIIPILMLLLEDDTPVDDPKVGLLLDAKVIGVKYKTSSGRIGTTNLNGEYLYDDENDTVEFFLDTKKLGQTTASSITSVLDFENGEQTAILLQSIDTDGNSNNGIQISPEVASLISSSTITVEEVDANSEAFRSKFEQVMGYPLNSDNFNAQDHAFEQLKVEIVRRFDSDIFRYLSEELSIETLSLLGERPPINSVYDKNPNDYLLSYYSRLRLYFHFKYTSRWLRDDVATRDDLIEDRADINARIEERSLAATKLIADFYNVVGGLAATKQALTDLKTVKHFAPLGNNTGVFKSNQLNIYDLAYDNAMNALTDDIVEQLAGEGANILADKLPDSSPIVRILKRCVQDPIVAGVTGNKISKFAALSCMSQSVGEVATEAVSIYNLITLDIRKGKSDSIYFAGEFLDLFYTFGGDPSALGSIFTQMSQEVGGSYFADKFDYERDIDTVLDIISRKVLKDGGKPFDVQAFYFKDTAKEAIFDYQETIKDFLITFNELIPNFSLESLEQGYVAPNLSLVEESSNTYKVCADFKNISSFDLQNISVNINFSSNENGFLGGHSFSINNLLVDGTSVNRCSNAFLAFPPNSELFYDLVKVDASLSFSVDREILIAKEQIKATYFEVSRQTIVDDLAYPLITVLHPLTIEEGEVLELDASGSSSSIDGDTLEYEWEYIPNKSTISIDLSSRDQPITTAIMPSLPEGTAIERAQFRVVLISVANGKKSEQLVSVFLKKRALKPTQIAIGFDHSCALISNGEVMCWGYGSNGQLGSGTTSAIVRTPVKVFGIENAKNISAGDYHTCAQLTGGTVKCWGRNDRGQLGNGTTEDSSLPVVVSGVTNAKNISAGTRHSCASLDNGTVKCWGRNAFGQLGNGTTDEQHIPTTVVGITNAELVSSGDRTTCALLEGGMISCWGYGRGDALGNAQSSDSLVPVSVVNTSSVSRLSLSDHHACAIFLDNTAKCWGGNGYGNLGVGSTEPPSTNVPINATELDSINGIAAAPDNTCGKFIDGSVKCWGRNFYGNLGDGTTVDSLFPVGVSGITNVKDVGVNKRHSCAVLNDGFVKCWGLNHRGQLGNGTQTDSSVPVPVTGLP